MEKLSLEEVKERLRLFADNLYPIPNGFAVHEEYLDGLSGQDFIKAFSDYRDTMVRLYRFAAEKPYEIGISLTDRNTGEEKLYDEFTSRLRYLEKLLQPHYFIIKICDASTLVNGAMEIDAGKLKQLIDTYPKIKNADRLIHLLIAYGFVFSGYNGKLAAARSITLTYAGNPHLIRVVKSFSESKHARGDMEFDYAHFNYRLLAIGKNENLPLKDLFVFNSITDRAQKFLLDFDASMNENGYSYGDAPTSGFCWGISQFAYSRAPEKKKDYVCRLYQRGDGLVVRLFLKNVNAYAGYIESAGDHIKDAFVNAFGKCNYCREVCKHRKTYGISGKEYNKCDGMTFEFYDPETRFVPRYLDLIRLSAKSG